MRVVSVFLAAGLILIAADKKAPQGREGDNSVAVTATLVSSEQIKQMFGTDFDNNFIVLDVTVAPKGGKPYDVRLDDFMLRSESNGDHSGPLAAGQITGAGAVVVERVYGNRSNGESPRPIEDTKIGIRDDEKANPAFDALKQKILIEKTTSEPESGFLFFPLSKEKPKNLILSYKTPTSRLRLSFR